jgi:hypothetical protein
MPAPTLVCGRGIGRSGKRTLAEAAGAVAPELPEPPDATGAADALGAADAVEDGADDAGGSG